MLILFAAASAASFHVSSITALPGPVKIGGQPTQQIQVELVIDCEPERCVVGDVALRARPAPGHEGDLLPRLQDIDARVTGAVLTLDPYSLDGQPLDEALLSRAMAGFEDLEPMEEGRSTSRGTLLAELPLVSSSNLIEVKHHTQGDTRESTGSGRIDASGSAYIFRSQVSSQYGGGELQQRTWWAVGERADASKEPAYLQGGSLRRLGEGERPDLGATEELEGTPSGAGWDALQAGLEVYRGQNAELPREPGAGPDLWVSVLGGGALRAGHDLVPSGSVALGANLDGVWFGVEGWSHTARLYRPFGIVGVQRALPVQMVDVYGLLGYRPQGQLLHPAVGIAWGASIRTYEGATPERLVLPIGGPEVRLGLSPGERFTVEFLARILMDGGATTVTRGQDRGSLQLASATVGVCITGEVLDL